MVIIGGQQSEILKNEKNCYHQADEKQSRN